MLQSEQKPNSGKNENEYKTHADRNRNRQINQEEVSKDKDGDGGQQNVYFHKDVYNELVTYVLNDQAWMMMAMNGISTG